MLLVMKPKLAGIEKTIREHIFFHFLQIMSKARIIRLHFEAFKLVFAMQKLTKISKKNSLVQNIHFCSTFKENGILVLEVVFFNQFSKIKTII